MWGQTWVVPRRYRSWVKGHHKLGRCSALKLQIPTGRGVQTLHIIGVHGGRDSALEQTLLDVRMLLRRKARGSKSIVLGDWNVDWLPLDENDPYGHRDKRDERHAERRAQPTRVTDAAQLQQHYRKPGVVWWETTSKLQQSTVVSWGTTSKLH